jgi:hypothetical protein
MEFAAVKRRAGWLASAAILVVSPACGPEKFTAPWLAHGDAALPYSVNRPAYGGGARPFFVSGYAGANYDSIVGRPRAAARVALPAPIPAPVPPSGPPAGLPSEPPGVAVSEGSWQTE